ncbi:hypothetical protein CEXT_408451 [Caerostris extrusa]|uniref:Uncharacterized protein n=1 Tax=Caerostris extrusa TaxID=172846 RepID=A0AAV4R069_CAEEX|nr:hypothetical protein CEXT_408451 [Caerostris extrusa]
MEGMATNGGPLTTWLLVIDTGESLRIIKGRTTNEGLMDYLVLVIDTVESFRAGLPTRSHDYLVIRYLNGGIVEGMIT